MFTIEHLHWLLDEIDRLGIEVWLDGGWGVDALLGRQTRAHDDVDIALRTADSPPLQRVLEGQRFVEVELARRRPFNFVYGHPDGRRIDFHLFDLDEHGNGSYGDGGDVYPALGLTGRGTIGGRPVRCIEATTAIRFHTGYRHDENDAHDVLLLCHAFDLELPPQYR